LAAGLVYGLVAFNMESIAAAAEIFSVAWSVGSGPERGNGECWGRCDLPHIRCKRQISRREWSLSLVRAGLQPLQSWRL